MITLLALLTGCTITVKTDPPEFTNNHYMTIFQQETSSPSPIPHVIEREVPITCNIPDYPEAPTPPDLKDVDISTLLGPEDTEKLLVSYIGLLREHITDREATMLNYYQRVIDICQ